MFHKVGMWPPTEGPVEKPKSLKKKAEVVGQTYYPVQRGLGWGNKKVQPLDSHKVGVRLLRNAALALTKRYSRTSSRKLWIEGGRLRPEKRGKKSIKGEEVTRL